MIAGIIKILFLISIENMIVQSRGFIQYSQYSYGFNRNSMCDQWQMLEGNWVPILKSNGDKIEHQLNFTVIASKELQLENGEDELVNNILDAISVKGLSFEGVYFPFDIFQAINRFNMINYEDPTVRCHNQQKEQITLYGWVIRGQVQEQYLDVGIQTTAFMCIPSQYQPKCPLGYCSDNSCQTCIEQQGKLYNFCDKRNCIESKLYGFACLTQDFGCHHSFVNYTETESGIKQVENCYQQQTDCPLSDFKIASIPLEKLICNYDPNEQNCKNEYTILPYNICCKQNPFVARICFSQSYLLVINFALMILFLS